MGTNKATEGAQTEKRECQEQNPVALPMDMERKEKEKLLNEMLEELAIRQKNNQESTKWKKPHEAEKKRNG